MSNLNLERYVDAVQKIKAAILQSRYRAASMANAEQLKLYYGIGRYVSDNSRFGKWGSGAIEAISKQLQQELPGLRGFSATNIRYMRIFFEAWADEFEPNRHLPTDDLAQSVSQIANRPLPTAILYEDTAEIPIHQLTTDELSSERRAIFGIRVEQGIGSGLMSGFHPSDELCARSEITGEMERMEKTGSPKVTAFKCPNCGAAANPDSASCHYCGAALTTRVCPSCFHAVAIGMRHCPHCGAEVADALSGPETAINCLRCDGVLEAHAVGDYSIPVCPRCGGVWLHKQTFHDICKQVDLQRAVLEFGFPEPKAPLPEGKPHKTYIPCPECGKLMNHKAFAHGSRVIIDYCRNHGVWLDRQELHGIAEFIKKDGMRRHHEWAMTELRGRESQLRFTPPSPMPGDDPSAKDSLTQNDPHKMELAHLRREIETRQSIEPLQWIFKQIFGTF